MTIAIGSDHRGYEHKAHLASVLADAGHTIIDCGCDGPESANYADAALAVGEAVATGRATFGVLICGSGIGVSIAANKVAGVRASLCADVAAATGTRQHNDSNVLCLSGDRVTPDEAVIITEAYLAADFEGGRHAGRVATITDYEQKHHQ